MSRGTRNLKSGKRSKLEERVDAQLIKSGVSYEYEPRDKRVKYTVPASDHNYLPDFVITTASSKTIYLEPKGLWDLADRRKHLLIRQQRPDLDIRFIFQRSKQRIRKGSKTTYRDVCEGRARAPFKGVTWKYCDEKIPESWYEE